ncbi:MAG: nucleotidyltransferase domain-containing protein [Thermoplasmata archaeon]
MSNLYSTNSLIENVQFELKDYKIPDEIVTLYIYGSILKGNLRRDSDIDAAFLPHYKVSKSKALELIAIVEHIFTSIFRKFGIQNEVSVLNMRGKYVSIELLFNIIRTGVCVYEKSQDEHFEFKNFVMREYLDFKPFLETLRAKRYGINYPKN